MGQNYYDVLEVPKGTSDENLIKKAYKKAALKYHPDRPGGDKQKFQEVSEAFEVLSDPKKKKIYDQFGEAGLGAAGGATADDENTPTPGMGRNPFGGSGGHTTFSFGTSGGGGGGAFHGSDPFSVFESIFGTMDVDQAMGSNGAGGGGSGFSSFPMGGISGMRMGGPGGVRMMPMSGMSSGMGGPATSPPRRRQAPPVEHTLNLSLEELYEGSSKRMRITKKTASGGEAQVDKTIVIKPGWKDGTRITFEKEGDEHPGMVPADIVFVIKTKPHPRFKRNGHNLECTVIITLEQALTGFEIPIETLDGRRVVVREPGIPSSSFTSVVRGEGMPSQKDRTVRGDLSVRYSVEFPLPTRAESAKAKRRQALAGM